MGVPPDPRSPPAVDAPAAMLDFDGTLADLFSVVDWSGLLDDLAEHYRRGGVPSDVVDDHRQKGWGLLYQMYQYTLQHRAERADSLQRIAHQIIHQYEAAAWQRIEFYPAAIETLAKLRELGYVVGIITNNTEETMSLILNGHPARSYLHQVIGRRQPTRMKPYPDQLNEFLDRWCCPRVGSFYVGDSVVDMRAAAGAGVPAFGLTTGRASREELLAHGAARVHGSLEEFLQSLLQEGVPRPMPPEEARRFAAMDGGERDRALEREIAAGQRETTVPTVAGGSDGDPLSHMEQDQRELFLRGASLFNTREFFEAHEVWEDLWRGEYDEVRIFYQGLIQIAAGFVKYQRHSPRGVISLLRAGLIKIEPYRPTFCGLDLEALAAAARTVVADVEQHPVGEELPPLDFPQLQLTPAATAAGIEIAPSPSPP